jgi:hypothetical protein
MNRNDRTFDLVRAKGKFAASYNYYRRKREIMINFSKYFRDFLQNQKAFLMTRKALVKT